jgi:hypothetical protein
MATTFGGTLSVHHLLFELWFLQGIVLLWLLVERREPSELLTIYKIEVWSKFLQGRSKVGNQSPHLGLSFVDSTSTTHMYTYSQTKVLGDGMLILVCYGINCLYREELSKDHVWRWDSLYVIATKAELGVSVWEFLASMQFVGNWREPKENLPYYKLCLSINL